MREKRPLRKTIEKYICFLNEVYNHSDSGKSLSFFIEINQINKTIKRTLIDLAIIDYQKDKKWIWLQDEPNRTLALTVLNHLLERAKGQRVTPIAGLTESNELLAKISEQFDTLIKSLERSFISPENSLKSDILFSAVNNLKWQEQGRKVIASDGYADTSNTSYENLNRNTVAATDRLLGILNKK